MCVNLLRENPLSFVTYMQTYINQGKKQGDSQTMFNNIHKKLKSLDKLEPIEMNQNGSKACYLNLSKNENNKSLADIFKRELRNWNPSFSLAFSEDDGTSVEPDTLMFYVEDYLGKYQWSNAKEWNSISSDFILARCFSFFRLTTEEIERKENFDLRRTYPSSQLKPEPLFPGGFMYSSTFVQVR